MRSCSIIQEGPKFNDRCALKGQEEKATWRWKQKPGVMWPQAKETSNREAEEAESLLNPGGRRWDLASILISVTWPPGCGRLYSVVISLPVPDTFCECCPRGLHSLALHTLLFVSMPVQPSGSAQGLHTLCKAPLTSPGGGGPPCSQFWVFPGALTLPPLFLPLLLFHFYKGCSQLSSVISSTQLLNPSGTL